MSRVTKNNLKNITINLIEKLQVHRIRKIYAKKICRMSKLRDMTISLTKDEKIEALNLWSKLYGKINLGWHRWYKNAYGHFDKRFVPEDIFYAIIEPRLSPRKYAEAYDDKGFYNFLFHGTSQPVCFIKNINGTFYKNNMDILKRSEVVEYILSVADKFIIKPSVDSCQGINVRLINLNQIKKGSLSISLDSLLEEYKKNFVIQKIIQQHNDTKRFHPDSLNTIRVISLFLNDEVTILSAVLRMGLGGSLVDNFTAGGIAAGIDKLGKLSEHAIDIKWQKYDRSASGILFKETRLEHYEKVVDCLIQAHKKMPNCRLISWDFAIDHNANPILIEVNLTFQELNFHQYHNGPLFKDRMNEMIEFVKLNKTNWFNLK